jgi:hypothetical protein
MQICIISSAVILRFICHFGYVIQVMNIIYRHGIYWAYHVQHGDSAALIYSQQAKEWDDWLHEHIKYTAYLSYLNIQCYNHSLKVYKHK